MGSSSRCHAGGNDVLAAALAGIASSEMTRAQYSRSLGAQLQSKAGDQWGFFQAKRLRSVLQRDMLVMLQGISDVRPLDAAALAQAGVDVESPSGRMTVAALQKGELPSAGVAPLTDPNMNAALDAVKERSSIPRSPPCSLE